MPQVRSARVSRTQGAPRPGGFHHSVDDVRIGRGDGDLDPPELTGRQAVLSAKLKRLEAWNEARRQAAARYGELLAALVATGDVETPRTLPGNEHIFHLYVVRVPRRDRVLAALQAAGIGAAIHYPTPLHLHGALRELGYRQGDFPVAEKAAGEILSLPLYPHLTAAQQERVADALRRAL